MAFMDKLNEAAGLLSTGSPMLDIGMGLLAQSGPVVGAPAPSLGQAFAGAAQYAGQRGEARLNNEYKRQVMEERNRQMQESDRRQTSLGLLRDAISSNSIEGKVPAQGFFAETNNGFTRENVPLGSPQGREAMNSLLFDVAPNQMVNSLLGTGAAPRTSVDFETYKALYPNREEGTEEFTNGFLDYQNNVDPEKSVRLALLTQQLENETNEAARGELIQQREIEVAGVHGDSMINTVLEMAAANEVVNQTLLGSGIPFSDFRRSLAGIGAPMAQLFGNSATAEQLQSLVDAYDTLERNSQQLVTQIATSTDNGFTGAMASGLRAVQAAKGGNNLSYGANVDFFNSQLDEMMNLFDANGTPISPARREAATSYLQSSQGNAPSNFGAMVDDQLLNIDPSGLTPEERVLLETEYDLRGL